MKKQCGGFKFNSGFLSAAASGLVIVLIPFVLFSFSAHAIVSSDDEPVGNPDGLVEVHLRADPNAPYQARRSSSSWRWTTQYENFFPNSYISPADQAPYTNIFGSNQGSIITMGLGYQWNSSVGAFYFDAIYGSGSVPGIQSSSVLNVTKLGGRFGWFMDTLTPNPWVSPFVAVDVFDFVYNEVGNTVNVSGTTAATVGMLAGISIHLNHIDESSAAKAYIDYGLKNTFIDIYGIQYNTSSSASDPDLQSPISVGAGLRLEF